MTYNGLLRFPHRCKVAQIISICAKDASLILDVPLAYKPVVLIEF
jgi:hypothetical protein